VSDAGSTRVDELVDALKRRRAPLPFEIGAYVALAACERLIEAPASVSGRAVHIAPDGEVRVVGAPPASEAETARALSALLAQLLVAAGPGVPPALLALVETRAPTSLDAMRDGLARALMPLNRAASRRVLARLVRESVREFRAPGDEASDGATREPSLDDDLDALLDAPPPAVVAAPETAGAGSSLAAALAALAAEEAAEDAAETLAAAPSPSGARPSSSSAVPATSSTAAASPPAGPPVASGGLASSPVTPLASPPSASSAPDAHDSVPERTDHAPRGRLSLDGLDEAPRGASGSGRGRVFVAVLVLAALAGLALFARPSWFGGDDERPRAPASLEAAPTPPAADALAQVADVAARGAVEVRCAADGAQVLVFVGRGPALSEPLSQGVAHEFVAIADGKAASRGVVPADAVWDVTPEGPRFELALQSGEADVAFDALELAPSRAPSSTGAPGAAQGRVRIITTPRSAKVYRVIGTGPAVRLEGVRTDGAIELIVAARGHVPERVVVGPSDWRDESGARVATLDVTLTPRPAN